jgi:hypothetical protein
MVGYATLHCTALQLGQPTQQGPTRGSQGPADITEGHSSLQAEYIASIALGAGGARPYCAFAAVGACTGSVMLSKSRAQQPLVEMGLASCNNHLKAKRGVTAVTGTCTVTFVQFRPVSSSFVQTPLAQGVGQSVVPQRLPQEAVNGPEQGQVAWGCGALLPVGTCTECQVCAGAVPVQQDMLCSGGGSLKLHGVAVLPGTASTASGGCIRKFATGCAVALCSHHQARLGP